MHMVVVRRVGARAARIGGKRGRAALQARSRLKVVEGYMAAGASNRYTACSAQGADS